MQLYFFPNECPGLCPQRPGHSIGEKIKLHEMKNEKKYVGFATEVERSLHCIACPMIVHTRVCTYHFFRSDYLHIFMWCNMSNCGDVREGSSEIMGDSTSPLGVRWRAIKLLCCVVCDAATAQWALKNWKILHYLVVVARLILPKAF